MADLTGKKIANTYKDLLQVNSSASNSGIDETLRNVQDGKGTNTPLKLSQTAAAFTGNVSIDGSLVVGGAFQPTNLQTTNIIATSITTSVLDATNITTSTLEATTLIFQDVSVSSLRTGNLKADTVSAGTVSATTIAATNITLVGEPVATSANLATTSAALQTNINTVSATLSTTNVAVSTNTSAISDIRTSIANHLPLTGGTLTGDLSLGLNTLTVPYMDIKASGTQTVFEGSGATGVRMVADATFEIKGANRLKTMFTGGELGSTTLYYNPTTITDPAVPRIRTQIGGTTLYSDVSITGDAYVSGTIFQAGVTVANTSAVASVNTIALAAASAGTSATLETRIAGVSSTFATTSATLESRIATVSSTMATSIATVSAALQTKITTNINAITSINNVVSALSSVVNDVNASAIAANAQAIALANTSIAANASSVAINISAITSVNTIAVAAMPKAGGTFTGPVIFDGDGFTINSNASAVFNGPARMNSDIILGNGSSDTITGSARWGTDIIPNSATGRDLGTDSLRWDNAYINTLRGGINAIGTSVTDLIYPSAYGNAPANVNYVTSAVATKASVGTSATLETRIAGVSSTFATTSATLETRIAGVSSTFATTSATLATSIATAAAAAVAFAIALG